MKCTGSLAFSSYIYGGRGGGGWDTKLLIEKSKMKSLDINPISFCNRRKVKAAWIKKHRQETCIINLYENLRVPRGKVDSRHTHYKYSSSWRGKDQGTKDKPASGCVTWDRNFFFRGIFWIFSFHVRYSTLLHLPPLRFHCVRGSNPGQLRLRHWLSNPWARSHPLLG
jgi:hypothetical protein